MQLEKGRPCHGPVRGMAAVEHPIEDVNSTARNASCEPERRASLPTILTYDCSTRLVELVCLSVTSLGAGEWSEGR